MIDERPQALADRYDVVVAGGGPAGLGAALAARRAGAERVLVVDREPEAGGILLQCIHAGFGLHHFGEELTGPEYAHRVLEEALDDGVDVLCDAYLLDQHHDRVKLLSGEHGVAHVDAGATVLAMGPASAPAPPSASRATVRPGSSPPASRSASSTSGGCYPAGGSPSSARATSA